MTVPAPHARLYAGHPRIFFETAGLVCDLDAAKMPICRGSAQAERLCYPGVLAMARAATFQVVRFAAPNGPNSDIAACLKSADSGLINEFESLCQWPAPLGDMNVLKVQLWRLAGIRDLREKAMDPF